LRARDPRGRPGSPLQRLDDLRRPGPGVDALVPFLDLAVPVDHHADPLGALLRVDIGAVGGADGPVGVADQGEREVILLGKLLVLFCGVEGDADDRGVLAIVLGLQVAEPATFRGSAGRIGLGEEPEDDRLPLEVRKSDGVAVVVAADEIGRLVSRVEH